MQIAKTNQNFRGGAVETDRQSVEPISSPRSKRNILKKKSVEALISLHTTAFVKGGGGPTEMGVRSQNVVQKQVEKRIHTPHKKRKLEGESSINQTINSDQTESTGSSA